VLATKFGGATSEDVNGTPGKVQGHPDYVARAVEGSLRRLGVDPIGLYYQHRVDPQVPAEDNQSLDTCWELGIGFVAYSPLGRGFLTGTIRSIDDLPDDDFRRISPRFQGANFDANLAVVDRVHEIAERKDVAASALVLAWVLAQGEDIVPIPGTTRRANLERNVVALQVILSEQEFAAIEDVAPPGVAAGERYPAPMMTQVNR
jgi:aryl-alcohol dehydrogenase-like predicted oxidoreductase